MLDNSYTALTREQILALAVGLAAKYKRLTMAEYVMNKFGILTFGIERVSCADNSMRYVNTGETYDTTVVCESGEYFAESWGGWYEAAETKHETETDTINCAYCGEFTPLCDKALSQPQGARHAWRETVCDHCGHYVDGSGKAETVSAADDDDTEE